MGDEMEEKYNKYWGDFQSFDDYMYFMAVLDPQLKIEFLRHAFEK